MKFSSLSLAALLVLGTIVVADHSVYAADEATPVAISADNADSQTLSPFQRALMRRMNKKAKKTRAVKPRATKPAATKQAAQAAPVVDGSNLTPFQRALLRRQGVHVRNVAQKAPRHSVTFRLDNQRSEVEGMKAFGAIEALVGKALDRKGIAGDKIAERASSVRGITRASLRRGVPGQQEPGQDGLREAANQGKGAAANGVTGVGDAGTGEDLDVGDFVVPVQYSATEAEDVLIDTVQSFLGDDSGHADNPQGGPSDRLSRCNDISGGCDEGHLPLVIVGLNFGPGTGADLLALFGNCDGRNQDCGPDAPVDEDINDLREDNCDERNDANCGNGEGERTADRETIQALQGIRQGSNPFASFGGVFSFALPNASGYDFYVAGSARVEDREEVAEEVEDEPEVPENA